MTNPYQTKSMVEDHYEVDVVRTPATYLVALLIGVGVAVFLHIVCRPIEAGRIGSVGHGMKEWTDHR